ncbi:MAG: helix-turn-helix transcriptional regulator [Streptosporangiaceae bacterium]
MLRTRVLADVGGVIVRDVRCRHPPGPAGEPTVCASTGLVLVRRGCFARWADGRHEVLCPTTAYLQQPGQEERFAHPAAGGDDCTAITLDAGIFADLFGEQPALRHRELPLPAALAVLHRRMLAAGQSDERAELALEIAANVAQIAHRRTRDPARRPLTPAQRRLAAEARAALASDPTLTLADLAARLSVSAHHLSRTFSRATGRGIAQHRIALRICAALDRLQEGEDNLARLAADLGFADHAHLTRTLHWHTNRTPSELRRHLRVHPGPG